MRAMICFQKIFAFSTVVGFVFYILFLPSILDNFSVSTNANHYRARRTESRSNCWRTTSNEPIELRTTNDSSLISFHDVNHHCYPDSTVILGFVVRSLALCFSEFFVKNGKKN
jgi:hypothetical protein